MLELLIKSMSNDKIEIWEGLYLKKENKKRSDGYSQDHSPPSQGHVGYEREPVSHDEQDSTIDITI